MNQHELDILLDKLGLKVPPIEGEELLAASHLVEEIACLVKKPRLDLVEPAHVVSFQKGAE